MAILEGTNGINKVKETEKITIYSASNKSCFVAIKNDINGKISSVIDLNKYPYSNFDKIDETYELLNNKVDNAMLIILDLDTSKLENAINSNDKQVFMNYYNYINKIVSYLQKELIGKGYSVDGNFIVLERTELDKKLANLLSSQNIGSGISYNELVNSMNVNNNPFLEVTNEQVVSNNMVSDNMGSNELLNTQSQNVQSQSEEVVKTSPKVKSRKLNRSGYVNAVVLMAILIGVTLLSIQLGKFLYSVYGS